MSLRTPVRLVLMVAAGVCCLSGRPAAAQTFPCVDIPTPAASLNLPRKYAPGRSQSEIDPAAAAIYAEGRERLVATRTQLNRLTEQLLLGKGAPASRSNARCLLTTLDRFARAGSLLGQMSPQAKDLRMFFLPSAATAFIAARQIERSPLQEARIEAWLARMSADSVRRENKRALIGNSPTHPHQINNHFYWTGYGALLVGIATHDDDAFAWGAQAIARGLDEVDDEGFLAPEVARDSRALSYHALALQPLAMGVLLLREGGQSLSPRQMGALRRLGGRTTEGVLDPSAFAEQMARRNGGRVIPQVEVPKTPPAIPLLMSMFGSSPSLTAVDARVRCYPNGPLGPSVGVWIGRTPALEGFEGRRRGGARLQRLAFPPTGYKVCVR